tara:strand:+ start:24 stop:182 length:159 start_codon:yes stop_codon:yes gene_type:complete
MDKLKLEIEKTIEAYKKHIDKTFKTMPKQTYVWFEGQISAYEYVLERINSNK